MKRTLVADERAARARKHLSKRYGEQLKSWAAARAADWQIERAWSVSDVVAKLDRLCTAEVWTPLNTSAEIADDGVIRIELGAFAAASAGAS